MNTRVDCIIDSHAHLGYMNNFYASDTSLENILKIMDKLYIDKILQTHMLLLYDEYDKGINESIKAFEKSNGRILSYLVFNPRKAKESLKVINDNINKRAFIGIKIHPYTYILQGKKL